MSAYAEICCTFKESAVSTSVSHSRRDCAPVGRKIKSMLMLSNPVSWQSCTARMACSPLCRRWSRRSLPSSNVCTPHVLSLLTAEYGVIWFFVEWGRPIGLDGNFCPVGHRCRSGIMLRRLVRVKTCRARRGPASYIYRFNYGHLSVLLKVICP